MTREEIDRILDLHGKWRRGEDGGVRANLGGANLVGANLVGADLGRANLGRAYLGGADLGRAYLGGADLGGANLVGADLGRANLGRANLGGADLGRAYLGGANLGGADLGRAYLGGAYLGGANLGGARGIVILTETEHGYRVIAAMRDGTWRIYAGCRDFTIAEARAHWGASDYHLPLTGRRILACLDWLEREIDGGLTL